MNTYQTTAAYISGAIVGDLWWPQAPAGRLYQKNLRGPWGLMDQFSEPATFRDALLSALHADGGDFQSPEFSADTVIRIERKRALDSGYQIHVKEILIADIEPDLVNQDIESCELISEDY